MADRTSSKRARMWVRIVLSVIICVLLIGGAGAATYLIYSTEPVAQSEAATRKSAALVEVTRVERGDFRPRLEVLGLVEPARELMLRPRVSGQVVRMETGFMPGGLVEEGQVLVGIDPADYEQTLTMMRSEHRQVQAELAIEEGRQAVARQEFELLGEEIDDDNRSLVLREPQIEAIRARLSATEAAVRQAELDLERTSVRVPFDAQVMTRDVNLGSQISSSDEIAHLVGTEEYWIMASVPLRDLPWIRIHDTGRGGASVRVHHKAAWRAGEYREGSVSRLIGTVDTQSRLAKVLVSIPDPLAMEADGPRMILGTIVELEIEGEQIRDVVRLDRQYLRQNDTVWVKSDGQLDIRQAEVVYRDAQYAYVRSGLEAGDEVVTTSLATVSQGLALRLEGESEENESGQSGDDTP
ncbi:MAG: efflux RND transporter periplasmic adaptor subunit [bacterium]|nr:efflux RND transporter periplasmic adaptor subunit [bacterium]